MNDLSELLDELSDADEATRIGKQVQTLRGVRGVRSAEIAHVASAAWLELDVGLPRDGRALTRLFGTAWEDGLVAIALLGAAVPDAPAAALRLGLDWAERVDDVATADALGWLVLGSAALLGSAGGGAVWSTTRGLHRPAGRRAGLTAALAWLPVPIEGPAAAALRVRQGTRHVQWVDAPRSAWVREALARHVSDDAPAVRKALRRVVRAWVAADPEAVVAWADDAGSVPRLITPDVRRARRALR